VKLGGIIVIICGEFVHLLSLLVQDAADFGNDEAVRISKEQRIATEELKLNDSDFDTSDEFIGEAFAHCECLHRFDSLHGFWMDDCTCRYNERGDFNDIGTAWDSKPALIYLFGGFHIVSLRGEILRLRSLMRHREVENQCHFAGVSGRRAERWLKRSLVR
jgi:hypothetical protein